MIVNDDLSYWAVSRCISFFLRSLVICLFRFFLVHKASRSCYDRDLKSWIYWMYPWFPHRISIQQPKPTDMVIVSLVHKTNQFYQQDTQCQVVPRLDGLKSTTVSTYVPFNRCIMHRYFLFLKKTLQIFPANQQKTQLMY